MTVHAAPRRALRPPSLLALKGRALVNALVRGPKLGFVFLGTLAALLVWGEVEGTLRALRFLDGFGSIGTAVFQRLLEIGLIVLSAGVTFSAVTTAISTLYLSDDLNFLLTQPLSARRVFALKVFETYLAAALMPTLLTLPIVLAVGAHFGAPWWYPAIAALATVLTYALPVGLGAAIAVVLMRLAPLGRVREVATALGVVVSAALVYGIRAARPEVLLRDLQNPQEFERLLTQFASPSSPLVPPAWAASGLWTAATGGVPLSLVPLALLAALVLGGATWLASFAYQEGWARGLDSSRVRLDPRPRGASGLERLAARRGPLLTIALKDARLLWRDPTQWSQLLVLVALAGVYLVSVRSFPLQVPQFRNLVGYVQLAFQGFVIAGVAVRLAFPAVSAEGRGYWLLRTGAVTARQVVLAKYLGAIPATLLLALVLGTVSAYVLALSDVVVFASVLVAASNALVITALGVGLGAALPRFHADNPAEIGLSPGGIIFMLLSLGYSVLLLALLARPTYRSIALPDLYPGLSVLATPEGLLAVGAVVLVTLVFTVGALWYGWTRLDRHE